MGWGVLGGDGTLITLSHTKPPPQLVRQEELEFCERLLQLCFETPPEESTMDR